MRATIEKSLETDEKRPHHVARRNRTSTASKPIGRQQLLSTIEYRGTPRPSRINQRKQNPSQLG